jgi:hypothetical protein
MTLAPVIFAADAPWVGKWKLNPAKSQLTGETLTIEKTSSGMIAQTLEGSTSTFRLDGKEYPTPDGGTIAVKEAGADSWDITQRVNGKVVVTGKISVKADTLTGTLTVNRPDGGTIQQSSVFTRVSGGPGFFGKWKSTQTRPAAATLEITANGADGVTVNYPEFGFSCSAQFDGKDYPGAGQLAGSKSTFSFKNAGPRSFEMTSKTDGKAIYVDTFTVSADGKTLTDEGTPVSVKEPVKSVYERQ